MTTYSSAISAIPRRILRPLSPFETLLAMMDSCSPLHATLAVQIAGNTTPDEWQKALEVTRQRHPLWSAVIGEGRDGLPCFLEMANARVDFRVIAGEFADNWGARLAEETIDRIDPVNGPLVRATLMQGGDTCMLMLSIHHSIADGMAIAFCLRDVLRALAGEALEPLPLHPSLEHECGLPDRPYRAVPRSDYPTAKVTGVAFQTPSGLPPSVRSLAMSSVATALLLERVHMEKTTVHGALMAAATVAVRWCGVYRGSEDLRICSTVSARRLIENPEDCCMLFSASIDSIPDEALPSFWDLARAAKRRLEPAQDIAGIRAVLSAVSDATAVALVADQGSPRPDNMFLFDIHLSNLGVSPIAPAYGRITVDSVWGPAVLNGYAGEQVLGVCTFGGRLRLLHTSYSPVPSFLNDIEEALHRNCAG